MNAINPTNPINSQLYRSLPTAMFSNAPMLNAPHPKLIRLNHELLGHYGLSHDWFEQPQALSVFSGNAAHRSHAPIAMAYSGHQFGNWVSVLGDGRAHMLGQITSSNGSLIDVQTKGSGRTAYSRGGDGRATLSSVLREYLVSEAMAGLNIPTTRSLAIVTTGETVARPEQHPGAILVRTANSHLRVGSFQFAASNPDPSAVQALADFVIRHQLATEIEDDNPYLGLLNVAIERQALLVSRWMLAGFIHGVMNTDNTSIVGETIDYGPCAFMDEFSYNKVFSSIDHHGRYAWSQQGNIALWNLTRFAETLLPLINASQDKATELATASLEQFIKLFGNHFNRGMLSKLGLHGNSESLAQFAHDTLAMLEKHQIDFTNFFDQLTQLAEGAEPDLLLDLFPPQGPSQELAHEYLDQWKHMRTEHSCATNEMRSLNPRLIARNHQVEKAIESASNNNDYQLFDRMCTALQNPFSIDPRNTDLQAAPLVEERVRQTFCGT